METNNKPELRTELGKYYKWVKKCRRCKRLYGLDGCEQEKNVCPKCSVNRWKT